MLTVYERPRLRGRLGWHTGQKYVEQYVTGCCRRLGSVGALLCHAVICRVCGTPLERIDELGIG